MLALLVMFALLAPLLVPAFLMIGRIEGDERTPIGGGR